MKPAFGVVREYLTGSIWRKRILFSLLGATGGFAYYYFIGCRTGTCPITGNPWISTVYGSGAGLLMTIGDRKKKDTDIGGGPPGSQGKTDGSGSDDMP
jgi:Family of unknown function (DUF6132)